MTTAPPVSRRAARLTRQEPHTREHLPRRPLPAFHGPFQVPLRVNRRMLAGEMAGPHRLPLRAGEAMILTDPEVRVGAERPRVPRPVVERRLAVPLRGEPREHRL